MPARGQGTAYQGSKWIRREKRLAIYLRDGLACCWCGEGVEDGTSMSLDHLIPYSQSGSHEASNLVTACSRCNSSRADRTVRDFSQAVAAYLVTVTRPLDVAAAKELIARRGGFSAVLASMRKQ